MAQVIMTIPDEVVQRVAQAFLKNYKYSPTVTNPLTGEVSPNPVSAQDFVFAQRIKFIKDNLKQAEVPDLALSDRAARIAEIDAIAITLELVTP